MATKKNKKKNTHKRDKKKSNIPFPLLMAMQAAAKKRAKTEEDYTKIMAGLESLDLRSVYSDPKAMAELMANPEGLLRNYVNEGVDPDADLSDEQSSSLDSEAVEDSSAENMGNVNDAESDVDCNSDVGNCND